jgi:hypothetical protein
MGVMELSAEADFATNGRESAVLALSVDESRALATLAALYFFYGVWVLSTRVNMFDQLRRGTYVRTFVRVSCAGMNE